MRIAVLKLPRDILFFTIGLLPLLPFLSADASTYIASDGTINLSGNSTSNNINFNFLGPNISLIGSGFNIGGLPSGVKLGPFSITLITSGEFADSASAILTG